MPAPKTLDLPMGRKNKIISIPLIEKVTENGDGEDGVSSAEWMVSFDELVESFVEGFEAYTEVFGFLLESSRYTTGDISNRLMTSATLKHPNIYLIIPNGGHTPKLESHQNTGTDIEKLTIVRLGNISDCKVKLQEILYETCRVQRIRQHLDWIILEISVSKKTNTVFVFDNPGKPLGQTVTTADYSKNTVVAA